MKTFLLTITLTMTSLVFACPGGHLKILKLYGQEIGQVNMSDNTVSINSSWNYANLVWKYSKGEEGHSLMPQPSSSFPKLLKEINGKKVYSLSKYNDLELKYFKNGELTVMAYKGQEQTTYYWVLSHFVMTRSMNACAQVEASSAN